MKYDYNKSQIFESLIKVGIKKNDIVYCHANLGFFGNIRSNNIAKLFFEVLKKKVGKNGTILFPSYSYSFKKNKINIHNVTDNNFKMGILSEYAFNQKDVKRTFDPMFSSLVWGKLTNEFLNISNNSFDDNSVFGKLYQYNGKILNLNFPGTTFLHFVERKLKLGYRYDKVFEGSIIRNSNVENIKWKCYLRKLSNPLYEDYPYLFTDYIKKKAIAKFTRLGKGEVLAISSRQIYNVVKKILKLIIGFLQKKELKK